jgi:TatD DNase family protein
MEFVDTHAHLYGNRFKSDLDDMVQRTLDAGVTRIYLPNIDSDSIEPMLDLEARYPGHCFPMMGLHPCHVKENHQEELALVRSWLDKRPFCAVGEIGIDWHWDRNYDQEQEYAFLMQTEWALELDLPIVIHCRKSMHRVLELLQPLKQEKLRGIFHCFGGTLEEARAAVGLGFLLGIGGVLTYSSELAIVVEQIELEHIVLETDAPYLAPVPYRGKRNESSYIPLIAEQLSNIKKTPLEGVARVTTENALKIFGKDFF